MGRMPFIGWVGVCLTSVALTGCTRSWCPGCSSKKETTPAVAGGAGATTPAWKDPPRNQTAAAATGSPYNSVRPASNMAAPPVTTPPASDGMAPRGLATKSDSSFRDTPYPGSVGAGNRSMIAPGGDEPGSVAPVSRTTDPSLTRSPVVVPEPLKVPSAPTPSGMTRVPEIPAPSGVTVTPVPSPPALPVKDEAPVLMPPPPVPAGASAVTPPALSAEKKFESPPLSTSDVPAVPLPPIPPIKP